MADIKYPEATYKIVQVGPKSSFDINDQKTGGKITLNKFALLLEGIPDWVNINLQASSDDPKVGDELTGHVEDTGKYGLSFKKASKGGGWKGGGGNPLGAAWSAAMGTAAVIVQGYYQVSGLKPKDFEEYFGRVSKCAAAVKATVDEKVKSSEPAAPANETPKTTSESGESPAPADSSVSVEGISDSDLGSW